MSAPEQSPRPNTAKVRSEGPPPDGLVPPPFPSDPIDITQAAQMLGAHVASLHRWRLKGKINAWKVGARWKVSKAEILAYPKLYQAPAKIVLPRSSTERQRKAYQDWAESVLKRAGI